MKTLSLKPFLIAGVKYADAHTLSESSLPPGTILTVSHDANNSFDPFALVVTCKGIKLGHIPRTDQTCFFYHTAMNVLVHCRVVRFDKSLPPYEQLQVDWACSDGYSTVVTSVTKPLVE